MDDATKKIILTIGAGLLKKGGLAVGTIAATHGWIAGNQVELFGASAVALGAAGYSFWNDYGKAIVLSQLEVLKAKSLAQAAKMKAAGVAPVTVNQIAEQSPVLTPTAVAKVVDKLPDDVKANIKPVILLAVVFSGLFAFTGEVRAQAKPRLTGNIVQDIEAARQPAGPTTRLTGNVINDLLGALDAKLLPDLQYALALANASGSKVTAPCYTAWIAIIETRQNAGKNPDGTPIPMPDPHIVTDFEKMVELRNALQPESDFMIKCSPVASMVKKDIAGFIGIVLAGGAGLATLVPGL